MSPLQLFQKYELWHSLANRNPYNYFFLPLREEIKRRGGIFWPFNINKFLYPQEEYTWRQVRTLYETKKAILVENAMKIWIPKSRIQKIRLRNNNFEIYVKENIVRWYLF